jgi:hypothetical protein
MNDVLCSITPYPFALCTSKLPRPTFPQAVFSGRAYRPEWEEKLLDLDRVYDYLALGRWFRANDHGAVHLGTYDYRFGYRSHKHTMEITFDPVHIAFVCQPEGTLEPMVVPARGLTKDYLMGDLAWILALPAYQLAFPLTPEDQRRLALVECLSGTTL